MEKTIKDVLDKIHLMDTQDRAERLLGKVKNIEDSLWALHPESAKLLNFLIKWNKPKFVLELGCSHAYSTIWIAEGVKRYGGGLLAIENNPSVAEIARKNVDDAGLSDYVEFLVGDCLIELKKINKQIDFIFCDIWDALYPQILPIIIPMIKKGGIIAFDNVSSDDSSSEAIEFREMLSKSTEIDCINVGIGNGGLELCLKN